MYLKVVVVLFICSIPMVSLGQLGPYETLKEGWKMAGDLPNTVSVESPSQEQDGELSSPSSLIDVAAEEPFARSVAKAARKMRQEGKITRLQQIRLRVAMLSPAYRQHARELAVTQMAFSGADGLPMDADGRIEVGRIDWESLGDFIERLVPFLLKLLEIFSQMS